MQNVFLIFKRKQSDTRLKSIIRETEAKAISECKDDLAESIKLLVSVGHEKTIRSPHVYQLKAAKHLVFLQLGKHKPELILNHNKTFINKVILFSTILALLENFPYHYNQTINLITQVESCLASLNREGILLFPSILTSRDNDELTAAFGSLEDIAAGILKEFIVAT